MKTPCRFCGFEACRQSDEDCPAVAHRYTMLYRPPSFATCPKGWVLVERPAAGLGFDRRTDLPLSVHRFGVIGYAAPLSDADVERFQMKLV